MKSVLISIQPKWCELIGNGKKTIEVRKTKPKLDTPFKCYIYCTASNIHECLLTNEYKVKLVYACNYKTAIPFGGNIANGKVIGEFVCKKIDKIAHCGTCNREIRLRLVRENLCYKELNYTYLEKCQLSYSEIDEYSNGYDVYGWQISDLVIYDKPRELSEFHRECEKTSCESCEHLKYQGVNSDEYDYDCEFLGGKIPIVRPPQSWCYVECEVESK